MDEIILAACRAHTPQFDRLYPEIREHAISMMRDAIAAAVANLVAAARCALDSGDDEALDRALEPFEELIPYPSTVEADISKAMAADEDLPYQCDPCSTPGYGPYTPCSCSPPPKPNVVGYDDEHLWRFWNEKARALAAENAALHQQLAETRGKALDEAAASVEAVAHEGRHASMWRNKFERVAETIRLMRTER